VDPEDHDTVVDRRKYMDAVVRELRRRGYNCAADGRAGPNEPEELIIDRKGDTFSETFRIYTSKGKVRRFYMGYQEPPGIGAAGA
jgi:hypothetical protein